LYSATVAEGAHYCAEPQEKEDEADTVVVRNGRLMTEVQTSNQNSLIISLRH
jgi:hypothetical protein